MMVFGGIATNPTLNAQPSSPTSTSTDPHTDFLNSPENSKQMKTLKTLNLSQQRLAKELERTRKRMNEEVAHIQSGVGKKNKKNSNSTTLSNNSYMGSADDSALGGGGSNMSMSSFSDQLGIDLTSLNSNTKSQKVSERRTCAKLLHSKRLHPLLN